MHRIFAGLTLLLAAFGAYAQTPIPLPLTGNLTQMLGSPAPYAGIKLALQNCPSPITITGSTVIVQTGAQIKANASGVVNSSVWPNDLINCNGTTGQSMYSEVAIVNGVPSGTVQCYQVVSTQGQWNLNTQQPIACTEPPPNPQDAQYRNLNITGCISMQGGACAVSNGVLNAAAYPSIHAAITALGVTGGQVFIPCGTYSDNIDLTKSGVKIAGAGRDCVTISPANIALPAIYFDANGAGTNGLNDDEVSDVTIACPPATPCADAILINGPIGVNRANNWIKLSRVTIWSNNGMATGAVNGFLNGLNILNTSIWDQFDNVSIAGMRNNGVNIVITDTTAGVNDLAFHSVRSAGNWKYGVYVNSANIANPIEGLSLIDSNIEINGQSTTLANCAGLYMTGTMQFVSVNTTYEANCLGNTADTKFADVRMTGTYNQADSFYGNAFNQSASEWAIYNDTTQTTGDYSGNKGTGAHSIYLNTGSAGSAITLGTNFNMDPPTIVADGNGDTHFHQVFPLRLDYSICSGANCGVSGGTLTLGMLQNTAYVSGGPYTLTHITVQPAGHLLYLSTLSAPLTISYASGSAGGQIFNSFGATTGTLSTNEVATLYSDGANWFVMSNNLHGAALTSTANAFALNQTFTLGTTHANSTSANWKNSAGVTGGIVSVDAVNNIHLGDVNNKFSGNVELDYAGAAALTITAATANIPRIFSANALGINGGVTIANSNSIAQVGTPTVNQAACIKAAGPPVVIGYCSTVVSSTGACTCN